MKSEARMTANEWVTPPVGDLVVPAKLWNPLRSASDQVFDYIDLSAIDQDAKLIIGAREVSCGEAPSRARQLVARGDVLVSTVRPNLNGVARVPDQLDGATASTGFCVLRAHERKLDGGYLFHWVRSPSFVADMVNKATGASYPAVSDRIIFDSRIPLPVLVEQRWIAEVLDHAEALRAKRRDALAQLDSLTQSVFLDLFGNPVMNLKKWKECAVGEATDCIVPGRDKPKSFSGNTPWITTDDLVHLERTFDSPKGFGLNSEEIREVRARIIPKGSVIISCVGDLGIVSIAGNDVVINQQLHSFQCHENLNNVFLMHCLAFQKAFMYAKASSTTLPYMNKSVCNSIPVLVPPIDLQREFARRVGAVEKLKAAQRASLAELDALFASLQHRAFRGEL